MGDLDIRDALQRAQVTDHARAQNEAMNVRVTLCLAEMSARIIGGILSNSHVDPTASMPDRDIASIVSNAVSLSRSAMERCGLKMETK